MYQNSIQFHLERSRKYRKLGFECVMVSCGMLASNSLWYLVLNFQDGRIPFFVTLVMTILSSALYLRIVDKDRQMSKWTGIKS